MTQRYELRQLDTTRVAGYLAALGMLHIGSATDPTTTLHFEENTPVLQSQLLLDPLLEGMVGWVEEHMSLERLAADVNFRETNPRLPKWQPSAEASWSGNPLAPSWSRLADGSRIGVSKSGDLSHPKTLIFSVPGGRSTFYTGLRQVWDPDLWGVEDAASVSTSLREALCHLLTGRLDVHLARTVAMFGLTETDLAATRRTNGESPIAPLWELLGAVGSTFYPPNVRGRSLWTRHWEAPLLVAAARDALLARHSSFLTYVHPYAKMSQHYGVFQPRRRSE